MPNPDAPEPTTGGPSYGSSGPYVPVQPGYPAYAPVPDHSAPYPPQASYPPDSAPPAVGYGHYPPGPVFAEQYGAYGSAAADHSHEQEQRVTPANLHQYAVRYNLDYLSADFGDRLRDSRVLSPNVSDAAEALATANRALYTYHGNDQQELQRLRAAVDDCGQRLRTAISGTIADEALRDDYTPERGRRDALHMTAVAHIYSVHREVTEGVAGARDRVLEVAQTAGRVMGSRIVTGIRRVLTAGGLALAIASPAKAVIGAAKGALIAPFVAHAARRVTGRVQARAERNQRYNSMPGMSARATAILTAIPMPEEHGAHSPRGWAPQAHLTLMSDAQRVIGETGESTARANYARRIQLSRGHAQVGARGILRDMGMGAVRGAAGAGVISAAIGWDSVAHNFSTLFHDTAHYAAHPGDLFHSAHPGAEAGAFHQDLTPDQIRAIINYEINNNPDGFTVDGHHYISLQGQAHHDFGALADPGVHHGYASTGMEQYGSTDPMGDIHQALSNLAPYEHDGLLSTHPYTTADGSEAFRLVAHQDLAITVPGGEGVSSTTIFVPAGGIDGLGYDPGVFQSVIYKAMLSGGQIMPADQAISQAASGGLQIDPTWLAGHLDIVRQIPGLENFQVTSGVESGAAPGFIAGNIDGGTLVEGALGADVGVLGGALLGGTRSRRAVPGAPEATVTTGRTRRGRELRRFATPGEVGARTVVPRQQGETYTRLDWADRYGRRGINSYVNNPRTGRFYVEELSLRQRQQFVQNLAEATGMEANAIIRALRDAARQPEEDDDDVI